MATKLSMNWSAIGIGSLIIFLIAWFFIGLFCSTVLAIVVLLITGTLQVTSTRRSGGSR